MREIKFRAWDNRANVMVTDFDIEAESGIPVKNEVQTDNRSLVLMQYTGLKDKNGKEIYEGDIVAHQNFIGVVEYFDNLTWDSGGSDHPGFYCEEWFLSNDFGELSYHQSFNGCEIIGNVHDNPELING